MLTANANYSMEDYRGFLLCIEPAEHKNRKGRAVATRSRPGPWEMVSFQGTGKGKKLKQGEALQRNSLVHVIAVPHNTALQVDQPGSVTPSTKKKATSFFVEYHNGYLALKTTDGRYMGTTKSGKLVCNRPKGNRGPPPMCLFRVFLRTQEFDDPRVYLPLGYKGDVKGMTLTAGPRPTFDDVVVELCGRFLLSLPAEELQVVSRLFFQIEQMWWFYEDHKADQHSHLPHMDHQEFGRQVFRLCDLFDPVRTQYDALYAAFKTYLLSVPVFGVFIMNPLMNKVVLVKSYNGSWLGFPRGKVNQNEEEVECAVREANEEIGIDLTGRVESNSFIRFPEGKKMVKLFLVAGVNESTTVFQTQTRKEIGNISWYDLSKSKSLLPSDQWKYLNSWIRTRKKNLKNLKKQKAVAVGGAASKSGKRNKAKNWQQSWGVDAMLTGVDGGGGQFIDEEYDEEGHARTTTTATTTTTTTTNHAKILKEKKRRQQQKQKQQELKQQQKQAARQQQQEQREQQKRQQQKKKQQRQQQQQQQRKKQQPIKILSRRPKLVISDAWKTDSIFQGKKYGRFKFDTAKILACVP